MPSVDHESLVMLFEWLGEEPLLRGARAISAAVEALLKSCATRTRELGGTLGSKAFTGLVIERL